MALVIFQEIPIYLICTEGGLKEFRVRGLCGSLGGECRDYLCFSQLVKDLGTVWTHLRDSARRLRSKFCCKQTPTNNPKEPCKPEPLKP